MNAVVAVNSDWGIGHGGKQTIVIPEDRRLFKKLTDGGTLIVGRMTFEDFGGSLPNRKIIILTRDSGYTADYAVIKHSIDGALSEIADTPPEKVFVVGGESIYRQFLPMCLYAYVTKIESAPPSDTFFPNLDELPHWEIVGQEQINEWNDIRFSFVTYKNMTNPQTRLFSDS